MLGTGLVVFVTLARCDAALASDPAGATPSTSDAKARQGRRLYQLGRWAEAIAAFEAAYEQSGEPALLYNMAQCHRRAGQQPRAAELYAEYLRQVPDAPNRTEIEERIREGRKVMGPPQQLLQAPEPRPATQGASPSEDPSHQATVVHEPTAAGVPRDRDSALPPTQTPDGVFVRAALGPGVDYWSLPGLNVHGSGIALAGAATVGFYLKPRWALYGELSGSLTPEPTISSDNPRVPYVTGFDCYGGGIGAAFSAWESQKISLSLSLLATRVSFDVVGDQGTLGPPQSNNNGYRQSGFGYGWHAGIAKTWQTKGKLILGAGFDVVYASGSLRVSERDRDTSVLRGALSMIVGYN